MRRINKYKRNDYQITIRITRTVITGEFRIIRYDSDKFFVIQYVNGNGDCDFYFNYITNDRGSFASFACRRNNDISDIFTPNGIDNKRYNNKFRKFLLALNNILSA